MPSVWHTFTISSYSFAIRKYFHKHVRHIMKNITVKYTGSFKSTHMPHPFCKNSLYIMYYTEKKTENYRINEKNIQSKTTYFA